MVFGFHQRTPQRWSTSLLAEVASEGSIISQQTRHPQRQGYQSFLLGMPLDICDPQCVPSDRCLSAWSLFFVSLTGFGTVLLKFVLPGTMLESSFPPSTPPLDKEPDSFIFCFPTPSPSSQRGPVLTELGRVLLGCEYFWGPWGLGLCPRNKLPGLRCPTVQQQPQVRSGALLFNRGRRRASPNYSFYCQH